MKKKLFLLFLLFLIMPISYGVLTNVTIHESFPNTDQWNMSDFPVSNVNDSISLQFYQGSAGFWEVGKYRDTGECENFLINVSGLWSSSESSTNQYVVSPHNDNCFIMWLNFPENDRLFVDNQSIFGAWGNMTGSDPVNNRVNYCLFFVNLTDGGFGICTEGGDTFFAETYYGHAVPQSELNMNDYYYGMRNPNGTTSGKTGSGFLPGIVPSRREYKRIIFYPIMVTDLSHVAFLDSFNLTNIQTGFNELPSFNLSFNNTRACVDSNNASSKAVFNVDIDVIDPEGDTILYSRGISTINFTQFRDFSDWVCILNNNVCDIRPDFDLIRDNFVVLNDTCEINIVANSPADPTKHNIVFGFDAVGDRSQLLEINGFCNKLDKAVYYNYKKIFTSGFISLEIVTFDINDSINISLLSSNLMEEYLHLNIDRNDSGYFVSYNLNDVDTFLFNVTSPGNFFRIGMTNTANISSYKIEFTYSETGIGLDTVKIGNINESFNAPFFQYLRISVEDEDLVHWSTFTSVLNQYVFNWVTTFNNTITFDRVGNFNYFIYVTDDQHENISFKQQNVWFAVTECGGAYDFELDDPTYQGFLDSGNQVYFTMCDSTNSVLQALFGNVKLTLNLCSSIYFVYMIFCLIIALLLAGAIYQSIFSPYLSFGISGLVFFLSQALLYRIFMFSPWLQTFYGFLFAVSIISIFIGLFAQKTL